MDTAEQAKKKEERLRRVGCENKKTMIGLTPFMVILKALIL